MILHLTSQYKGRRVLICGDSVTVTDNAGLINFSTKQLERGCTVDDGKHNTRRLQGRGVLRRGAANDTKSGQS
jgi:hypothetical protein